MKSCRVWQDEVTGEESCDDEYSMRQPEDGEVLYGGGIGSFAMHGLGH